MNLFNSLLLIENFSTGDKTNGNSWSSILHMLGQFFLLIIVFIVILFLAYYFTKLVSSVKYKNSKNSNLKIIESIGVGYQSSIQLIKVGDKVILIGITKEKISFICEVNENSINTEINNNIKIEIPDTFQKYLQNFMDKKNNKKEK
jgi:flagellar protein FliO/FliZ